VGDRSRRVAVVTGGAGGIGRAIARRLAAQCDVVLWDRAGADPAAAARLLDNPRVSARVVDVTAPSEVRAAADAVIDEHGRWDILINAAGIAHIVPFADLSEEDWDRMIDINLKSVFLCTQAALPAMRAGGFGRVVSVSSVGAYGGSVGHAHYAAAKAGIIGFSKTLAKELGPLGITVNCVAPGTIQTPMLGSVTPDALARYAQNPIGRVGTPDEVAAAVEYFASDDAGYTTGWVLSVNGGAYT